MRLESTWVSGLLKALDVACVAMLGAAVTLNFANITGRYVFHAPVEWAEEIMLYLMIGFVFVGSAKVGWMGQHIRMDVLARMMPPGLRLALQAFSELAAVMVSLVSVAFAWPTILQLHDFDQRSVAADIPMFIPHAMIPIGFCLLALFVAFRLVSGRWKAQPPSSLH